MQRAPLVESAPPAFCSAQIWFDCIHSLVIRIQDAQILNSDKSECNQILSVDCIHTLARFHSLVRFQDAQICSQLHIVCRVLPEKNNFWDLLKKAAYQTGEAILPFSKNQDVQVDGQIYILEVNSLKIIVHQHLEITSLF